MAKKEFNYKEAVIEIDEILKQIERNELDVDELSVKVKRVSELIKACKAILSDAQKDVEAVLGVEE
ncbi:MAG: exodeoxyribonuclease VII small subunit [Mangrovibacterium sp.]